MNHIYTQDEFLELINVKANKSDVYNTKKVDLLLQTKADINSVYPKDDIIRMLKAKSDKSDSFTKIYLNEYFCRKSDYYSKEEIKKLLDEKLPESYVYTVDEINKLLSLKRNVSDSYTKKEIDLMLKKINSGGGGGGDISVDLATDDIAGILKTGKAFGELSLNSNGTASVNQLLEFKNKTEKDILQLQQSGGGNIILNNYIGKSTATKDQVESDKTILDDFAISQGFTISKGLICDTADQYRYRCYGQNGHWILDSYIFDVSLTQEGYLSFSNGNAKVNGFDNMKTEISSLNNSISSINQSIEKNTTDISKLKELLGNIDPQEQQIDILNSILNRLKALESRASIVFIDQGTTEDQLPNNTVGVYK